MKSNDKKVTRSNCRKFVRFIFSMILLTLYSGCGPSKYNLRIEKAQKGMEGHSETESVLEDGSITFSTLAGSVAGKRSMNNYSSVTTRVLEVDRGKSTLEEVLFEKSVTTFKTTVNGKTETQEERNPLHGVTLLVRQNNGILTRTLKSGQPSPEQERELQGMPSKLASFYPDRPLAIGESWGVSPEQFKCLFGSGMLTCEGSLNCTFARIEIIDSQKCAVIIASLDIHGSQLDKENNEVKIARNFQGIIYRSLKDNIDLKSEMKGTMKLEGDRTEEGQKITITITGPVVTTTKTTVRKY